VIARVWSSHITGLALLVFTMYSVIYAERSKLPSVAGFAWALIAGAVGGLFLNWMGR
jgi:hypothetical protein